MPNPFYKRSRGLTSPYHLYPPARGLLTPGTVDLPQQPNVPNPKGGWSTVDSFSVNIDGKEVLLPKVTPDGRYLTPQEAEAEYRRTGKHLGMFADVPSANEYAGRLHESYATGPLSKFYKRSRQR